MTTVLVHGNPETSVIWREFVPELEQRGVEDVVLLSPPGFGSPIPDGFGGTLTDHREWLIGKLESIGGPIDIVGHDWGAGHVFGVVAQRPDLVRTWAADCAGLIHPDYKWHPAAQDLQTPGAGEDLVAEMIAMSAEDYVRVYGVPVPLSPFIAERVDDVMGRAILPLYRSAVQPVMRELGERLAATERPPGLIFDATADTFVDPGLSREMADRLGVPTLTLAGSSHWWMTDQPAKAADGLLSFWS